MLWLMPGQRVESMSHEPLEMTLLAYFGADACLRRCHAGSRAMSRDARQTRESSQPRVSSWLAPVELCTIDAGPLGKPVEE